jgi:hypothetical protein
VNEDFGLSRFDYTLSAQDSLSTSFSADRGSRNDPQANPIMVQNQANALYTLSAQGTHIFSPTVVNTANFGWSRTWANQDATPAEPFPDSLLFLKGGNRSNPGAINHWRRNGHGPGVDLHVGQRPEPPEQFQTEFQRVQ